MPKPHLGTHLLRVRIASWIFLELQEIAEKESERTNTHVTVSDLARSALYNELLVKRGLRDLESISDLMDEDEDDEDDESVSVYQNPMLNAGN